MAEAIVNLKDVAKTITLKVTLKNKGQLRWRIWIAGKLIELAAWVAWMNVEFVENEF